MPLTFLPGFSKRRLAIAGITAVLSMPAISQPQTAARREFEVASIKRSDPSHAGAQTYFVPGGKFTALTAPLKSLVCFAYQLRDHQVAGGPGWFDSEPFDISAKADGPAGNDELRIMVQALLADRFQDRKSVV